jgi:hypothetical protein
MFDPVGCALGGGTSRKMEENAGGEASGQLVAGPGSVAPSAAHVDTYVASNLGVSQASDRAQEYAVPASAPAMYYGGMYPQGSAGMASVGMPSVSGGTMISGMSSGPHHHTAMMGNQMTQFATLVSSWFPLSSPAHVWV